MLKLTFTRRLGEWRGGRYSATPYIMSMCYEGFNRWFKVRRETKRIEVRITKTPNKHAYKARIVKEDFDWWGPTYRLRFWAQGKWYNPRVCYTIINHVAERLGTGTFYVSVWELED